MKRTGKRCEVNSKGTRRHVVVSVSISGVEISMKASVSKTCSGLMLGKCESKSLRKGHN